MKELIGERLPEGEEIPKGRYYWAENSAGYLELLIAPCYTVVPSPKRQRLFRYLGTPIKAPVDPKDGEWWMCTTPKGIRVLRRFDNEWWVAVGVEGASDYLWELSVTPICKVEEVK